MQFRGRTRLISSPAEAAQHLAILRLRQWFERKSGRASARDVAVPLIAMTNAEGSNVIVGVHERVGPDD